MIEPHLPKSCRSCSSCPDEARQEGDRSFRRWCRLGHISIQLRQAIQDILCHAPDTEVVVIPELNEVSALHNKLASPNVRDIQARLRNPPRQATSGLPLRSRGRNETPASRKEIDAGRTAITLPEGNAESLIDGIAFVDTLCIMNAKVSRWGNSLALRLPKGLAASHNIFQDSNVEIIENDNGLLIRPSIPGTYVLEDLLEMITDENCHSQVSTGSPKGVESW